ncbi:MAG: alpha-L-arabinofuranosidase C-terminal domain-containing protein [Rhodothermales bacterium]
MKSSARILVHESRGDEVISRHLYGHFAEHLGRGIYDGIWFRRDGKWELREDIVEALRRIRVPNIRWPGGCFADGYDWKDGVGPLDSRPAIVNSIWAGVTEDNSFGTHEFMDLVERLGAEAVIVGNVGSGTVREMAEWWRYMNHPGPGPMADLRKSNGREKPWNVRFWGVGNENWGCGGNMRPAYYADLYKRFASFLHPIDGHWPFRIAAGPAGDNYDWMEVVLREAAKQIDGIDLHHYTLVGNWSKKGAATGFPESEWMELLAKAYDLDGLLRHHIAIMDRYDPEKRIWLILGEWGTWHEVEAGTHRGFLHQQNTLRDAIAASISLNILNCHAGRVKMANIAQTVNVLQAMVLTRGEEMLLTPTYHVFDLYTPHHDARLMSTSVRAPSYTLDGQTIPSVSASASKADDGSFHLTLCNVHPHVSIDTSVEFPSEVSDYTARILTGPEMDSRNTFEDPDAVRLEEFSIEAAGTGSATFLLPARSVVAITAR